MHREMDGSGISPSSITVATLMQARGRRLAALASTSR